MYLDFLYDHNISDVAKISCAFYGNEGIYRGWMFDKEGRIIGDYSSDDSLKIESTFKALFRA